MLADKTVKEFLDETASNNPVPGGGSIAAESGATAAALVEMVANLTIGKKKYVEVEEEMKVAAKLAKKFRETLLEDIDRDAKAFDEVMKAFKMAKETDEEKAVRREAIQEATKEAANVPLEVAKKAYEVMDLAEFVVKKGNKNAVTDGAVAAMLARTAVLSALYNVKINLGSIKDEAYVAQVTKEVEKLEAKAKSQEKEILKSVVL
ncbi:cyclodeaminase/cyclohydrolase family protein [Vallitalea okinawensis]|uniref:cyclodeaminase/cyclohydrolase family protein n=1 Tax=Vallitalea okinawensis TaxID=2078660 RepID=UPI000CFAB307|nr:cyclodeaminase/cyclohydrolase family protein [Vallitalea okinawensis]